MGNHKVNKAVKKFLRYINYDTSLENIIEKSPYDICFYTTDNSSEENNILDILGIRTYAEEKVSFCFQREDRKIIFISDKLPYKNKVSAILHEIGHLELGHTALNNNGQTVSFNQENAANSFADRVLQHHKRSVSGYQITIIILLLLVAGYFIGNKTITENMCFVTRDGSHYHTGCEYLKKDSKITWMTIKKAKEMDYDPCKRCIPEEYKNSDV